jgi:hypothetical protein
MYLLNGLGLNRASYLVLLTLFTFFFALPMAWASATQVEQRFYRNRPQQGLGQGRAVSVPAE